MQRTIQTSFPWQLLLDWYKTNGRHHLPWRQYGLGGINYEVGTDITIPRAESHHSSLIAQLLYRIWLSEILLQQTQVDRVIPFYARMLAEYPTVQSLAGASYDEFFPYYQGLGYYSRARNILKTAKIVSESYHGIFPRDKKLLMTLPGVGGYTSSAILAFGYGEPYLSWDTNLEKVFARYYHGSKLLKLSESEKEEIERDFRDFLSGRSEEQQVGVRAINNALMDFASMIDVKNSTSIDWDDHPIPHGLFYETRGSMEPQETKVSQSFPIPDATVIVILHQDHRVYYTLSVESSYTPFILPASEDRDTRRYVQDFFREQYSLELSVRPVHRKWFSTDGKPYIAVNAQIQAGDASVFREYGKSDMRSAIEQLYPI